MNACADTEIVSANLERLFTHPTNRMIASDGIVVAAPSVNVKIQSDNLHRQQIIEKIQVKGVIISDTGTKTVWSNAKSNEVTLFRKSHTPTDEFAGSSNVAIKVHNSRVKPGQILRLNGDGVSEAYSKKTIKSDTRVTLDVLEP